MLEYRILGRLEVVRDGEDVAPTAAKVRSLLAALLLRANDVVSIDQLVDALWGERPPESAGKLLHVYVSQLRSALGADELETVPPGYRLRVAPEAFDAVRFERLREEARRALADDNPELASGLAGRALGLWRGEPLADVAPTGAAQVEAGRLAELRIECRLDRLDAELALGRHGVVLPDLQQLCAEHPLRERVRERLALALYRGGRQAEALEVIAEGRRLLRDELGLEPGEGLRRLEREILNQDPTLGSPATTPGPSPRIPVPSSRLVGRSKELQQLTALVTREDVRIVTISGAGGSGKTRVALELARTAGSAFANGAAFVELASIRDPTIVIATVAQALGVPETADEGHPASLARWLTGRELLLVVDNLEHVVDAAPELARLVNEAPRLTVLVTSRRVLHVGGEYVFPLQPLPENDAVRFFADRAEARDPTADGGRGDEETIRAICRRLDCLPLALEIAAARTATLTPSLLLARLTEEVTALGTAPRDAPARQQTLADTLAWSTDLLAEDERRTLARLSVFAGGCSLEAAEAVCEATLETVGALVDASLLQRTVSADTVRLTMLETVREHAAELLERAGDRAAVESAHAAYFAALAESATASSRSTTQPFDLFDLELDNYRAAWDRADSTGDDETALRLATPLYYYWYLSGYLREGRDRIRRPLDRGAGDGRLQSLALGALAGLTWLLGDPCEAEKLAKRGIAVGTAAAALDAVMRCHTVLGIVARDRGELASAAAHIERSGALAEELGLEEAVTTANTNLADLALMAGDFGQARRRWEHTLAQNRERGLHTTVIHATSKIEDSFARLGLGAVAYYEGQLEEAADHFSLVLELSERAGFRQNVALALVGLAAVAAARGEHVEAALKLGRASDLIAATGGDLTGAEADLYQRAEASALAGLGAERLAELLEEGRNASGVTPRARRLGHMPPPNSPLRS